MKTVGLCDAVVFTVGFLATIPDWSCREMLFVRGHLNSVRSARERVAAAGELWLLELLDELEGRMQTALATRKAT